MSGSWLYPEYSLVRRMRRALGDGMESSDRSHLRGPLVSVRSDPDEDPHKATSVGFTGKAWSRLSHREKPSKDQGCATWIKGQHSVPRSSLDIELGPGLSGSFGSGVFHTGSWTWRWSERSGVPLNDLVGEA